MDEWGDAPRARVKRRMKRTYGKPAGAIRIPETEVRDSRVREIRKVQTMMTNETIELASIELPDGIMAVRIAAREYVFVDADDVGSVAAYKWQIRAINNFNGAYKGAQTFWDEDVQGQPLRYRMFLHDLLMDTPEWVPGGAFELDGPRWTVKHLDSNGMNCTRRNMQLVETEDGYAPVPQLNLPRGVWWNYKKHWWAGRILTPDGWYVELGHYPTFEEAAIAYFSFEMTPEMRHKAQYAHGTPILWQGQLLTFEEWQELRSKERGEVQPIPIRRGMTDEERAEWLIKSSKGRGDE